MQDGVEDRGGSIALERKGARRHFVQEDPEGKEVRARIQLLAEGLFRRHIYNRSKRAPRAGQVVWVYFLCG